MKRCWVLYVPSVLKLALPVCVSRANGGIKAMNHPSSFIKIESDFTENIEQINAIFRKEWLSTISPEKLKSFSFMSLQNICHVPNTGPYEVKVLQHCPPTVIKPVQ